MAFDIGSLRRSILARKDVLSLVENGTHLLVSRQLGLYGDGEAMLATKVVAALAPGTCVYTRPAEMPV